MPFVVTAGQITTTSPPVTPALPYGVRLSDTLAVSYETLWRTQPVIRTVVGFLARNIAQLGLHVYRRVSDTDRERLHDHPLSRLLAEPLPPEFKTSRYRLINTLVCDLAVYDNAFWIKLLAGDRPGLQRIPPCQIRPAGTSRFAAEGYELLGTPGPRFFPPDQVVHFFGYNPADPRLGVPPIETLRRLLAEEHAANTYREQLWRNGARAAGYLRRPLEAPDWSDTARERFRADWQAQYTGDGPQAGGTPILEDGMEWLPAAVTPEQAQYLESRKLTREEVAAAYHVPPPMLGILDHATFSNITEQHKMLYQDTLGPWLTMLAEDIELQLLPDLDPSGDVYAEFNIDAKMRGSFEDQARSLQALVGRPVLTADEGRALLNRNALGGDAAELITPLNVVAGGQASPQDSAPEQPDGPREPLAASAASWLKARPSQDGIDEAAAGLRAFFERQGRAVASAAGGKTQRGLIKASAEEVFDRERWDRELAAELLARARKTSGAAGRSVLDGLGLAAGYDEERTLAWLGKHAAGVASGINGVTARQLAAALGSGNPAGEIRKIFETAVAVRAMQIATTEATAMAGFGMREAVQQAGRQAAKTWQTTSRNPRASHAALAGETVAVDEVFSNGARWPGDSLLDDDERAGCSCDMDIQLTDEDR